MILYVGIYRQNPNTDLHMAKSITEIEWDNTPKSVKQLVKRLVDTVRAVLPDES